MILTVLATQFISIAQGQDNKPKIEVLANATEKNIMLRWAPSSPIAWQRLNEYGYIVERVTVSRNGELLNTPEKLILTEAPLKPRPLNDWQGIVERNDNAAVAAQAIYGETFELTENYSSDIMQVVNKSIELEQRFSFALFAADQYFFVAQMSALSFIDHTPRANEKYLYRVKSAVPVEIEDIDMGFVYVGLEDRKPVPKIYDLQAVFGNRAVVLSWERENFDGIYNSFIVEKSSDGGKTYMPVSDEPIINASKDEIDKSRRAYKLDSLAENNKTYYYRVKGITAFGETSPPSDSVSGSGFMPIAAAPNFTKWTTDNVKVDLEWQFPSQGTEITGFRIERSRSENGPYQVIESAKLNDRSYEDEKPLATNYYRVVAYNSRSQRSSFPVLVQLEDSIPPVIPNGLSGLIDSVGTVALTWDQNAEDDLLGYRIYRSNFKNSEFVQVTKEAVERNNWLDTVNVKTLTSSVYYQISAVDFRFNESERSPVFSLRRPDVLPPAPPVFRGIKSVDVGIQLSYTKSPSADTEKYFIYRRGINEEGWTLVRENSTIDSTIFIDQSIQPNIKYFYTITAKDSSGLESRPSEPVAGSSIKTISERDPERLKIEADRSEKRVILSWEFDSPVEEFRIYRKRENDVLELYKTVAGSEKVFYDSNVQINSQYQYGVQAVVSGGLFSRVVFSTVNF